MRYDERPIDDTPIRTTELPATPVRDRNIPASAWVEAPEGLLRLGDDLPGRPIAEYKRRIGTWLLWRAGPATDADAIYWACPVSRVSDPESPVTFRLRADGTGHGIGPSGREHHRFRDWKLDLLATEGRQADDG